MTPAPAAASPSLPLPWARLGLLALLVALAAYHALSIASYGTVSIDGVRHFLADDDVLISMRYARNLARGVGLVLNPGERVEGFTNPLLTLIGAAMHLAGIGPARIPLALDILNLGASAGILLVLFRFWSDEPDQRAGIAAGLVAGALYVLGGQHLFYAHAGYEVYLQALALLYGLARFDRLGWGGALAVGLLPLTHATSSPGWLVLVLAMLAFHPAPRGKRLALAAVAALPVVAYQLFRVGYYGEWVPNTFWLKVGAGKLAGGVAYARAWLRLVLPAAVLAAPAVVGLLRDLGRAGLRAYLREPANRRLAVAAAVLCVHLGEVVSVGGDYFPLSRFLFPCTVLVAALGGRGAVAAARWAQRLPAELARRAAGAGLAAVALAASLWPVLNRRSNDELIRGRSDWDIHHLALGMAIRDNTPPETRVALFALGYAGYYGDRAAIDMLGKADRHIARRPANPRRAIAHNKTDFDYVLGLDPDLVELALRPVELRDQQALAERSRTSPHGYQAELALNARFQRDYAPSPVTDGRGRPVRLYARAGTMNAAHAGGWRVPEAYFETDAAP